MTRSATSSTTACPYCGFSTVIKKGTRVTHVRLGELRQERCEMERYYCRNCQTTWGATTDLVEENHSLSYQLKHGVMAMVREGMTNKTIAKMCHCSASSVACIVQEVVLPKYLCFDEFRSADHKMSFICCDAENDHEIVAILADRLTKNIVDYFLNRYSVTERQQVETIVIDLNAQYASFIHQLFPNAEIIIDRFHIIQMVGRSLDNARIQLLKQIKDHRCREYKVLKSQWRLFHKDDDQLEFTKLVFLRGINEFMTQQDAVDLILRKYPDFVRVYETYQGFQSAQKQRDVDELNSAVFAYENTKTAMDQTIRTLRHSVHYIANSAKYDYSNGSLEGINRKIKNLKRSCCGFRNFENLLRRIDCIRA
ncbi:ISL3 family transposase [Limosilactobacillus allomucosae]|uniref:ISL3 family transposase n=1 Tax=Limosilactobacillus allomucosae TaxID=3142938 RepID=UPI00326409FB